MKAAFDRLPEHFRTLVLLVDVEGLTYREAAEALNVPIGTVMSRLNRGRGLLRLELARHVPRIVNRSAKRNGPVCTAEGAVVNLDCQQVREVMDSYLSEELSVETNHGVLRHMAECRDCAAELKRRQRLRALLSETLDLAVNDVNADRVRMRITHAVDREQRSWQRVARLGAVAATLVAAVAVVVLGGQACRRGRL